MISNLLLNGLLLAPAPVQEPAPVAPPAQAAPAAEAPKGPQPVTLEDYAKFERLGRAVLSRDGRAVAFTISKGDDTSELVLRLLAVEEPVRIPQGGSQVFSDDGQWFAYLVRPPSASGGGGGRGRPGGPGGAPESAGDGATTKMGLRSLVDGKVVEFDSVSSFRFSPDGRYLAIRASGAGGATLVIRHLASGTETALGNVSDYTWHEDMAVLALSVKTDNDVGNAVQWFDPGTGALRVLDSGRGTYEGLSWREDEDDLAVYRSRKVDGFEEPTYDVLVWQDLARNPRTPGWGEPEVYRQDKDEHFPAGLRITGYRPLEWSKDGRSLFFGLQDWEPKAAEAAQKDDGGAKAAKAEKGDDEKPGLEIWHTKDKRIQPMQKSQASRDRRRTYLAVWHRDEGRALRLQQDLESDTTLLAGGAVVLESDDSPYLEGVMFRQPAADYYRVDARTGERTLALRDLSFSMGASQTGRWFLFFRDDQYWTWEAATGKETCLTAGARDVSFADLEDDHPYPRKPPYRSFGGRSWLQGDQGVLLYDEFDVWLAKPDGSAPRRLTRGREQELVHRVLGVGDQEDGVDPKAPLYFSLQGKWSKQSGFARGGLEGTPRVLLLADAGLGGLQRAEDADLFCYQRERYDDSPDLFVCGADFEEPRAISATNAFLAERAWGDARLIEYQDSHGNRLQGALYGPAGFEEGRRYPMIVYVYEKLSQGVHRFVTPSETSPYNTAVFTSQGYFVLQPDIVFQPREPGVSAVDCIEAAVKTALAAAPVDPARVGLVGHSWGGYEATYVPTRTDLFAATVAGAPLTNFLSFMGQIHWSGGVPETSHWEYGQARMVVPYWEDFDAHVRNSPATFITDLKTPMLMTFGNQDGSVDWHQGVEFYNFARRAGKHMVLLVYDGEGHGLRKEPNQKDYHHRVLAWFAHYLKGEEAPAWITEGVPHLEQVED